MDFSTVLQMQESCSCVNTQNFMSIGPKVIGNNDGDWSEKMVFGVSSSSWRSMWRKLKRGKRKICRPTLRSARKRKIFRPTLRSARVSYDPETYAMNFDHGVASFKPARFADPSWISSKCGLVIFLISGVQIGSSAISSNASFLFTMYPRKSVNWCRWF
ncbi:hypothetical protein AMTRI_Chr05g64830 [Amborella trichopoda]